MMAAQTVNKTEIDSDERVGCACCFTGTQENVSVTELEGPKKNKAIAEALKNEEVKELRKKILDKDFVLRRDQATAKEVTSEQDGQTVFTVRIPFRLKESKDDDSLPKEARGGVLSFVKSGNLEKVILTGPVILFEDAWELVKENQSYQTMVQNYTANGLTVAEERAQIGVRGGSDIAWISVPVVEEEKMITARVNLETGEVLSVKDPLVIPGYSYIGTYSLDDICWVVSGTCFGLFLFSLADLLPGDEAFVGTSCGLLTGGCWIVETVARYTWCDDPEIVLYQRAWWNPLGPELTGYPIC